MAEERLESGLRSSDMHSLHILDLIALIVVVIGGLNWLLVGLFQWDAVYNTIGLVSTVLARVTYVIVGIAAIYAAIRAPAMAHFRAEPSESMGYRVTRPV